MRSNKHLFLLLVSAFIILLVTARLEKQDPPKAEASSVITLDGSGTGRAFEGEGGVSAGASSRLLIDYPEPQRSQILDYLFKPDYGASLQDLKVEIGGDVNSTDGSEPSSMHSATDHNYSRGYEWWLMQQAKLRNPNITLSALEWGAPGWIGNGQFFSQDNINYIIDFIQGAKTTYGLNIDYVGIWNETDYNTEWIKSLKNALVAAGLNTKIVAADQGSSQIASQMLADPALMSAVDVVGLHYPQPAGSSPLSINKPLWASEDGAWRGDWIGATYLAESFNKTYIDAKITKHEIWSPVSSYYDNFFLPGSGLMYANTPWSGNYNVQPAIWAVAQTNQFAQAGWQYIDNSSARLGGGGSYVTIKNGSDYSVIIETVKGSAENLTFNITGGLSTGTLHVWKSNATDQFVQQSDIVPVNGSFSLAVDAGSIYSLTTTTGQSKGGAVSPQPAAFPFPYTDNFESYATDTQAKYFSDINGSFEVADCGGGRGAQCLRQAVNTAPIPWHLIGPFEPATILGSTSWTDYEVSADVLLEQPGQAKIIGRLTSEDINSGNVSAYQLYVSNAGGWTLRGGNSNVIASGNVPFSLNTWHNLKLIFNGNQVQVVIDNNTLATVTDNSYSKGMAGLGTQGWTNAQFDNFRIDSLPGAGQIIPQSQMSATANSASGYEAYKAIDGNTATFWNTPYSCIGGCHPTVSLPQSITLSLGATYDVDKIRYLTRQDDNLSGAITSYNIYTSTDGTNFTKVAGGNWAGTATEKNASFDPTPASYIRLEAVSALDGYVAADEINVEYSGTASPPPSPAPSPSPSPDPTPTPSPTPDPTPTPVPTPTPTPPPVQNNFITGKNLGSIRNDFSGWVGMKITVGSSDITVNSLGRMVAPGNSQVHNLKIVQAANGIDVAGGNTAVAAQGASAGSFVYSSLTPTIVLSANTSYYILSQETAGGDQWYDANTVVQTTSAAALNSAAYSWNGAYITQGSPNNEYVPVDFGYTIGSPPPPPAPSPDPSPSPAPTPTPSPSPAPAPSPSPSPSPTPTPYITSQTLGSIRNDYSGWVGMKITVGSNSIDISSLGRMVAPGNSQVHNLKIVQASNGVDVSGSAVSLNTSGDAPISFAYATLTSPITLSANTSYFVLSQETAGGDQWYDANTIVQTTADAVLNSGIYSWNGAYIPQGSGNHEYVPVNFTYALTSSSSPAPSPAPAPAPSPSPSPSPTPTPTPPPASGTPFTLVKILGTIRNDYSGWVGTQIKVGSAPITITALGRIVAAGNSQTHNLKIVLAANGTDISGATATANTQGATAGDFVYGAFAEPVVLNANTSYYILSQETAGGDQWYDYNTTVLTTPAATVMSAVYGPPYAAPAPGNHEYVPVDFIYY